MNKKSTTKTCRAAQAKKDVVKRIAELGKKYTIIGIVDMTNLPASSLASMKRKLRDSVEIVMTRKTLTELGIKKIKLDKEKEILEKLKGMPAILFTKENPFKLYKIIKQSKTPAAAKPGDKAPYDLIVPAGPTPFTPGPIISEFAQLGIKAGVENGKIAVKADAIVAKEGAVISDKLASMLQKLGIEPMEVGLDLHTVYEAGTIYPKSVLDVDEKQFMENLNTALSEGFNLAIEMVHLTKYTAETLITKATREARNVGIEANIMSPELVADILSKAQTIATNVAKDVKIETQ
ncbi:50S ribosomal protein L10 [Candidatus Woesearchaeota archaeon CG10_big_fil_rev_8_21_14_0_10_37_12]|nr:MAG: 50S ribosomal protein L10 [Candidatus Woesearchaeota archaeon CG10_big_fil_rev_8_21_14_0_10_37_12]